MSRVNLVARCAILAVAALAISLAVVVVGPPVAAQAEPPGGMCPSCGPTVTPVDAGFLARVRTEMGILNDAASNPQPCTTTVIVNGVSEERQGILRWRSTALGEEGHDELGNGTETGTWYRQECFVEGVHTDFGELLDLREFEAINPQALAQVAIDDALAAINTHTLMTSPTDEGLVGMATWYWAADIPGQISRTASVPGMSVTVTAGPEDLRVDPGDGRSVLVCGGLGVAWAPGASSDCTATYQRAGTYTVTATLNWTGTYTVNGAGPFDVTVPVTRVATRVLPVAEAQAIND
ncbi:MAG TPA: hypothetical protein VFM27_05430 [Acidimicrobiales bacterium]|nr:hypothetical protein [Acidimicrobiales bacterium]